MELQSGVLSPFGEWHLNDITLKSIWRHSCCGNRFVASLVNANGRQCIPCSINFSMTSQTEILLTVTLDFLKQMIIIKAMNSV